jgi:hypothetical protein
MVEAIASFVGAFAWPAVALLAVFVFRGELRGLIPRVREAFGTKFDPPPQSGSPGPSPLSTPPPATGVATTSPATGTPLPFPRTPASLHWEGVVKKWLESIPTPAERREEVLVATLGRVFLVGQFQNLELFIWRSQLALLAHLNARVEGETLENLKRFFYDPAAANFPGHFREYPFEQYLAFLERNAVIAVADGRAHIVPAGREYLAWRIEVRRPATLLG